MFLHLGIDKVVPLSEIIAIFDTKIADSSINRKNTYEFKNIKVVDISENNAKSFILTKKAIYLSAISSQTLKKRAERIINY